MKSSVPYNKKWNNIHYSFCVSSHANWGAITELSPYKMENEVYVQAMNDNYTQQAEGGRQKD